MLRVWMRRISMSPGFSDNVFNMLRKKAERMSDLDRICCLVLDEVSLKCGLSYCTFDDNIIGFEDLGAYGSSEKVANHALVLMARGLFSRWKQPLAYFLVCNSIPASKLHAIVTQCVLKLRSVLLNVECVICDQGATNRQMFDLFGSTVDKPYVDVAGQTVHFLYDPPHLLKCLRNNLMKYDFQIDDRKVSWQYIVDFYQRDSKQKLRLAPRLSDRHLNLPPFAGMRVRLAAQIFSHSVAAGMYTHVALNAMPADATFTAEFIEMIDGWFDCFNTGNLLNAKELRRGLTSSSPHWEHLKLCKSLFMKLKIVGCRSKVPCISGVVLAINCLEHLYSYLHEKMAFAFLLTNRLNQDCLENHFAVIRGRGGFRDNPTHTCLQQHSGR